MTEGKKRKGKASKAEMTPINFFTDLIARSGRETKNLASYYKQQRVFYFLFC